MNEKNIFSNNLNYYMKLYNKTRTQVSNDLGISYNTFTDWVKGKKYPRMDKVDLLANYFNISKSDLIEDKGEIGSTPKLSLPSRLINELGTVDFTDDEVNELINFAKYLISKR